MQIQVTIEGVTPLLMNRFTGRAAARQGWHGGGSVPSTDQL